MTFVGTVTYPMIRWYAQPKTSDETLTTYPTAVTSISASELIRPSNLNPDDSFQAQKSRARGIAIYPITEGTGSQDGNTFRFQIVGWVRGADGSASLLEYRPIVLWTGDVTIGAVSSTNWEDELSNAITVHFAKNLVEHSALPPSISGLAGATPILHVPADVDDKSPAFLMIPDFSHLFWGLTVRFNLSAAGGTAVSNANLLIQYLF